MGFRKTLKKLLQSGTRRLRSISHLRSRRPQSPPPFDDAPSQPRHVQHRIFKCHAPPRSEPLPRPRPSPPPSPSPREKPSGLQAASREEKGSAPQADNPEEKDSPPQAANPEANVSVPQATGPEENVSAPQAAISACCTPTCPFQQPTSVAEDRGHVLPATQRPGSSSGAVLPPAPEHFGLAV
ncbi:hypothetical protein BDV95DRAFT_588776 [Massariosphaeria phaeospora]|uniref:Uncharacterized protein n=1 Tax=Massariosphaeria phaeospora TaxID=100035 RepID=A0A7C8MHL2_9PLEO|nr:hypothetical protein BDV95DRAFT_588776 [Massariosphaeria phaeospora]